MAACDLARPAAIDQLETLGRQSGVEVFADRAARLRSRWPRRRSIGPARQLRRAAAGYRGRLHVDDELMQELRELKAEVKPHETLLVVDAMTGQDAVQVATSFRDGVDFDALVLTKVDGDARGGAALSIRAVTGRPVQFLSTARSWARWSSSIPTGSPRAFWGWATC